MGTNLAMLELDHLMICVPSPEAAVRALTQAGLALGSEGVHRGQGTSNACFFFDNAYLELVWVAEPSELGAAKALGLETRLNWPATGASPFGLSVRPTNAERTWPFETWPYAPPFLPAGVTPIPVLANSALLHEPLAFVSFFPGPPKDMRPPVRLQSAPSTLSALGARNITSVSIAMTDPREPSKELQSLADLGLASFRAGSAVHHAELTLDGGDQGQARSFEPDIPLTLRW